MGRRKPVEDDQLLRLFWNRAELKREFAKLQRERERMLDQLRAQESLALRSQQRLEQLEGLLADPERAACAAVFYQLRGIWAYGKRRLTRLARDLSFRQQEREGQREAGRFEEHRQAALMAIERRLQPLEQRRTQLESQLVAVHAQRLERRGFWNYFPRRRLGAEQANLTAALKSVDEQVERYTRARSDKLKEKAEAPEVVGVDGKRFVNLSVIALAQELLLQFRDKDVASQARDASLRQVHEASYGDIQACRDLSGQIESVLRKVERMDELAGRVRRRAEYLRVVATYRRDSDTTPAPESLGSIPVELTVDGDPWPVKGSPEVQVNILADEYWDIYNVLLN
jgi:hypothetical protein